MEYRQRIGTAWNTTMGGEAETLFVTFDTGAKQASEGWREHEEPASQSPKRAGTCATDMAHCQQK